MKKSLLFVAAMFAAVGANAQQWNAVAEGVEKDVVVVTGGTETQVGEFTGLTIFACGATDWAVKGTTSETFTDVNGGFTWNNGYIQGGTNGSAASLIKDGSISSHIKMVPTASGTIWVAAKFGKNKPIWAAKVANAELEDVDYADMSAYLYTYEGKYIKDDGTYGGDAEAAADQYSALPLAVEAGNTYFFWVSGSKLMLIGANFVSGGTGIETVKAAKNVEGVAYNLAGQKVSNSFKGIVIKNGVKMIQK